MKLTSTYRPKMVGDDFVGDLNVPKDQKSYAHDENLEYKLIHYKQILHEVRHLSEQVCMKLDQSALNVFVCLLKGGAMFFSYFMHYLDEFNDHKKQIAIEYIRIKTYKGQTKGPSSQLNIDETDIVNVKGRNVFIVDEIIDSGSSMVSAVEFFKTKKPKSITTISLLNKRNPENTLICPDYCAFEVPNEWIVGFGCDMNGHYRYLRVVCRSWDKPSKLNQHMREWNTIRRPMSSIQNGQPGFLKLPIFKIISNCPIIKVSENMDIAIGDKDLLAVLLRRDNDGSYNTLDMNIESCTQQLDISGVFNPVNTRYAEIKSHNVGKDASELSHAVITNMRNLIDASRPRFLTFIPRKITNAENLLVVGFRSNHCGIFKLDPVTTQYHLVMDVITILERSFSEKSYSTYNLAIEDIKFAGVSLYLLDGSGTVTIDNRVEYFSTLKFVLGCVFLKKTTYIGNSFEINYIVLFVRFSQEDIQILGEVSIEPQHSSSLAKCVFEQMDQFNYVAYCCYCDSSMDMVVFNLNNYYATEGNTISLISLEPNMYSTGEIKQIIHLNNNHTDTTFNCTTIIVQSFNVTFMEWSLMRSSNLIELLDRFSKNIEIDGLTGIKSFFKVSENRYIYHLEQGGMFCIEAPLITDIHVKTLRLNTNYNLFHIEMSPLECFFICMYHIPLRKSIRKGFGKSDGFLVEIVPNVEIDIDNCFQSLIHSPFLLTEFKQYLHGLHHNKITTENRDRLVSTLLNHIKNVHSVCIQPSQICTLGNIEECLELMRGGTHLTNENTLENLKFMQRLELRLFMMCIYEKTYDHVNEFFNCIYQLYLEKNTQTETSMSFLSRSLSFLKSVCVVDKDLKGDDMIAWKICEYCIKTECSKNHFDYNERQLIPLPERTWAFNSNIECDLCLEMFCLTNLHYIYCPNGHRVKRCQLSYKVIPPNASHLECSDCKMPFSLGVRHWIENNFNCLVCIYCLATLKYQLNI